MKLGDTFGPEHLQAIRENWEGELADGYEHARSSAALDTDLSLSLAVTLSIMRGMQDTIDELRSRLAYLEGKR